jgi:hypothetical protein
MTPGQVARVGRQALEMDKRPGSVGCGAFLGSGYLSGESVTHPDLTRK